MINVGSLDIPSDLYEEWQDVVDLVARLADVPACLIMRLDDNDIEVFVASKTSENPYKPGDKESLFDSGLYCEHVVRTDSRLHVTNALKSAAWRNNPDVRLNMISYLGFPVHSTNGKPFGTLCVLDQKERVFSEDICSLLEKMRNLIESHLQLQERFWFSQQLNRKSTLRQVLDNLPTAILCASLGPDLLTLYINKRFTQLFGYDLDEIATLHLWAEHAYPDPVYRTTVLNRWSLALENARSNNGLILPGEYNIRCKDGDTRIVVVHGQLIANMSLISFIDITAERKSSQQLLLSERRHRLLSDHAGDLIWTLNVENLKTTYISPSVHGILGYTQEMYLQLPLPTLFTATSWQHLQVALSHASGEMKSGNTAEISVMEMERICADGSTIWTELCGRGIYDVDGNFIEMVFICRDITERKRHERKILQAKSAAESNSKAMSEMLGAIAHQWRQPLSTVGLVFQSIRKAYEHGCLTDEFIMQADDDAQRQIHFMSETIDTFRSFFNPNKQTEVFATEQIIRNVIVDFEQHLILDGIFLTVLLRSCPPVSGNPNEFQQVFINLLINAKEAILSKRLTGWSGPGMIQISQKDSDGQVQISVQDNGGGIDTAVLPRIFEPYVTTKDQSGGTGIGLYICRLIVEKSMSGAILATNTEDGARFSIVLQGEANV